MLAAVLYLRIMFLDGVDAGRRYKNGDINDAITNCKRHEQKESVPKKIEMGLVN